MIQPQRNLLIYIKKHRKLYFRPSEYPGGRQEGLNISNNSPQHVTNYWVNYQFRTGALRNFGLGAGGNCVSDAYFDDFNLFLLPSYHVVNASAFYENNKLLIGFKLNNIGDQKSWGFWGAPNPTRNFVTSLSFKF